MSNLLKKEKGFTLIEIVLVLAIAGLIMVIVFLALSGAQKNRRDTQRKQDNARLMAQIESYASNSSGSYPAVGASWGAAPLVSYVPTNFNDPLSGTPYTIQNVAAGPVPAGGPACTVPTSGVAAKIYVYVVGRTVDSVMCLEQGYQDLSNQ